MSRSESPAIPPRVRQYPLGVGDLTTRVLEVGDGDRHVVCLHGAGSRADRWRGVLDRFVGAGLHVIVPDLPGHGLASKPAGYPYGAPAFADVVEGVLDELVGDRPVAIVGTSLGGHVAGLVALRRPEQVLGLVLVGAVGLVPRGPGDRPAGRPVASSDAVATRAKLELLVHDPSLVDDAWVEEEHRVNSSPGASEALAALATHSIEHEHEHLVGPGLAGSDVPILLCWGDRDRWVPPRLGLAAAELLGERAGWAEIPDAGHAPYFERPDAFADVVVPFLVEVFDSAGPVRPREAVPV